MITNKIDQGPNYNILDCLEHRGFHFIREFKHNLLQILRWGPNFTEFVGGPE